MRTFFDAKADEIQSILQGGPQVTSILWSNTLTELHLHAEAIGITSGCSFFAEKYIPYI